MRLIDHPDTHDPALNLALEEYCLRHLDPREDYLLLYVNAPAVIVGRHQYVPAEVNLTVALGAAAPPYRAAAPDARPVVADPPPGGRALPHGPVDPRSCALTGRGR